METLRPFPFAGQISGSRSKIGGAMIDVLAWTFVIVVGVLLTGALSFCSAVPPRRWGAALVAT